VCSSDLEEREAKRDNLGIRTRLSKDILQLVPFAPISTHRPMFPSGIDGR